jgi:hypothetical protein
MASYKQTTTISFDLSCEARAAERFARENRDWFVKIGERSMVFSKTVSYEFVPDTVRRCGNE